MERSQALIQSFRQYIKKIRGDANNISPLKACTELLLSHKQQIPLFLRVQDVEEKYYWISNVFSSLLPVAQKKRLAAHFTPPHIARYTIRRLEEFGFDITTSHILDPASGGAAFLMPLSAAFITKLRKLKQSDQQIKVHILKNLSGIEIDSQLSKISILFLKDYLKKTLPGQEQDLSSLVLNADSLKVRDREGQYDAVISNPPYGRILKPEQTILDRFSSSLTDKHVNKYALFTRLSIEWAKPGGFVALIIPTSFIAGPAFRNLRKSILLDTHVLAVDLIDKRKNCFLDVLQDACILFLKKKNARDTNRNTSCRLIHQDGTYKELGAIGISEKKTEQPWILPDQSTSSIPASDFFSESYAKIADYGYGVRAGYFVWNRQKDKCREGKVQKNDEYPLIWAHCVKANKPCWLSTHRLHGKPDHLSFIKFEEPTESLIDKPSIILQRTTNRHQAKRLIAGYIPKKMIDEYGALISENHTIVIYPLPGIKQEVSLKEMCKLLNSKPVDQRYRRICGTVNVSVKLLREMPLPRPKIVKKSFLEELSEEAIDLIIETCYRETTERNDK